MRQRNTVVVSGESRSVNPTGSALRDTALTDIDYLNYTYPNTFNKPNRDGISIDGRVLVPQSAVDGLGLAEGAKIRQVTIQKVDASLNPFASDERVILLEVQEGSRVRIVPYIPGPRRVG
jgi:hypothetical protein